MNIFESLYYDILLEAIWDVKGPDPDESPFYSNVYAMYELQYKLSVLQDKKFTGHPKRMENMLKQVEPRLAQSTNYVKNIMLETFQTWLKSHALLNPRQWAEQRANEGFDTGESDKFQLEALLSEYNKYANISDRFYNFDNSDYQTRISKAFSTMINNISQDIENYPIFKSFVNDYVLPSFKEDMQYQLDDSWEDFASSYNLHTEQECQDYIDNFKSSDIDVRDVYLFKSIETFCNFIDKDKDKALFINILTELYEMFVFPMWYGYWKQKGIDKTRKNIEYVYENLSQANESNLGNLISWTNIALNTAHQNGSILDYIEQDANQSPRFDGRTWDIKDFLQALTDGDFINKWDNDLKEIGMEY